ncbi:hypothetical protein [Spiroplasma endosymbiont of Acasis viretata]
MFFLYVFKLIQFGCYLGGWPLITGPFWWLALNYWTIFDIKF